MSVVSSAPACMQGSVSACLPACLLTCSPVMTLPSRLPALPTACSKNITFGPADVAELVSLLDSGAAPVLAVGGGSASAARSAPGAVVRPSR